MISPAAGACGPSTSPWRGYHAVCPAGLERIKATPSLAGSSHPSLPRGGQILSVDSGLMADFRSKSAKNSDDWYNSLCVNQTDISNPAGQWVVTVPVVNHLKGWVNLVQLRLGLS